MQTVPVWEEDGILPSLQSAINVIPTAVRLRKES